MKKGGWIFLAEATALAVLVMGCGGNESDDSKHSETGGSASSEEGGASGDAAGNGSMAGGGESDGQGGSGDAGKSEGGTTGRGGSGVGGQAQGGSAGRAAGGASSGGAGGVGGRAGTGGQGGSDFFNWMNASCVPGSTEPEPPNDCLQCWFDNCSSEIEALYGRDWYLGPGTGSCPKYVNCVKACGCTDDACEEECFFGLVDVIISNPEGSCTMTYAEAVDCQQIHCADSC